MTLIDYEEELASAKRRAIKEGATDREWMEWGAEMREVLRSCGFISGYDVRCVALKYGTNI